MTTTNMNRTIRRAIAPLLALVGILTPLSASAAKPITGPPEPVDDEFVVPAGVACDFDVLVTATGKLGAIVFEDGRGIFTAPGLTMTLSRPGATGVVSVNATGTFHDHPVEMLPDGSFRWRTDARGHNLLFGPFDEAGVTKSAARLYVGNVSLTITVDATTGIATFSEIDTSAARVIDICAELA